MGIDIEGGMIVGAMGCELLEKESKKIWNPENETDIDDFADENGMTAMALYYDADVDDRCYGFPIEDIRVEDIRLEWIAKIRELGEKFERLTGVNAWLVGTQHVR